jgi:hypothetical protein
MRQKLDFSLLVLTSCIVVLALEPAHHPLGDRAVASELSPQKSLESVQWVNLSEEEEVHRSPNGQIVAGTEERILRLLERNAKNGSSKLNLESV